MPSFVTRYATPLITGLFLVSLVSGVALFFHLGTSWFHGMHEWLSMVLIVPFVLHLWKNWRPVVCYLKRAPMWIALAVSAVAAAAFAVPSSSNGRAGSGGRPAQFAFAERMMGASVDQIAPALGTTPELLRARFEQAGIVTSGEESLATLASSAGHTSAEIMAILTASAP